MEQRLRKLADHLLSKRDAAEFDPKNGEKAATRASADSDSSSARWPRM